MNIKDSIRKLLEAKLAPEPKNPDEAEKAYRDAYRRLRSAYRRVMRLRANVSSLSGTPTDVEHKEYWLGPDDIAGIRTKYEVPTIRERKFFFATSGNLGKVGEDEAYGTLKQAFEELLPRALEHMEASRFHVDRVTFVRNDENHAYVLLHELSVTFDSLRNWNAIRKLNRYWFRPFHDREGVELRIYDADEVTLERILHHHTVVFSG